MLRLSVLFLSQGESPEQLVEHPLQPLSGEDRLAAAGNIDNGQPRNRPHADEQSVPAAVVDDVATGSELCAEAQIGDSDQLSRPVIDIDRDNVAGIHHIQGIAAVIYREALGKIERAASADHTAGDDRPLASRQSNAKYCV